MQGLLLSTRRGKQRTHLIQLRGQAADGLGGEGGEEGEGEEGGGGGRERGGDDKLHSDYYTVTHASFTHSYSPPSHQSPTIPRVPITNQNPKHPLAPPHLYSRSLPPLPQTF